MFQKECIYLHHFGAKQKLTQHCKSTIFQFLKNQIVNLLFSSSDLSFLCFPTWRPYFKLIHHLCATSLPKISSTEEIYLCLGLIISTYFFLLIFTCFTELLRGIIKNTRWENLLADAGHTLNVSSDTHADA